MKEIIFASILCSIFARIKAPYSRPYGEFLGRYPIIQENVRPSFQFPSRSFPSPSRSFPSPSSSFPSPQRNPSYEDSPVYGRIQPNYELEELQRRLEMIKNQFTSISDQLGSRPRLQPPEPFRFPSIFSEPNVFNSPPPAAPPISAEFPGRILSSRSSSGPLPSTLPRPLSFQYSPPFTPPNSGNSYWNPVQCDSGICARRREFRPNPNLNQEIGRFPWSNPPPRFRVSIPVTTQGSTDPPDNPSVEPNRPNDSSANPSTSSESTIDPPAASNNLNSSSVSQPVEPDQPSNPAASPDPPKEVSKDEEIKPPKNEIDDSKKPEETPQPKSPEESSKKQPGGEEWEGPKTPEEDKPEYFTKDENIKFIQAFTSDMTRLGKYKVAETIRYLLTEKKDELDDYDRAAIRYVVDERLKKDPEIKEALQKYNEKHKDKNTVPPNDVSISDQRMSPPFTPQTFPSSNYSPQFRNPPRNEIDSGPVANNRQIFGENVPAPSFLNQQSSPPTAPPPLPFQSMDFPYLSSDLVRRFNELPRQNPVRFNPSPPTSTTSLPPSPPRWPPIRFQSRPEQ